MPIHPFTETALVKPDPHRSPLPFAVAVYSVPTQVQYMHDKIPRPDAAKSMKLVTNVFGPDLLRENAYFCTSRACC